MKQSSQSAMVMLSKGKLRDRDAFFVSTLARMYWAGQVDLSKVIDCR